MPSLKLIFFQILLCALLAVTSINGKRMYPADLAREKEFPYTVGLKVYGEHVCGGAILDSTHIVTAGECARIPNVDLVQDMVVVCGTIDISNAVGRRVKKIEFHRSLWSQKQGVVDDIAIITLRTPIKFNEYQKPVALPTKKVVGTVEAIASGWGDFTDTRGLEPFQMWRLDMEILPDDECKIPDTIIRRGHICARPKTGRGRCSYGFGGPLVIDGELIGVGVSSVPYPCDENNPDLFMTIYPFLEWINDKIRH